MLGPLFGALNFFLVFAGISLLLAVGSGVLFVVKRQKGARVLAVLTGIFLALTGFVYWEIWGFTWFG